MISWVILCLLTHCGVLHRKIKKFLCGSNCRYWKSLFGILWQLAYSLDFIGQANGDYKTAAVFLLSENKQC